MRRINWTLLAGLCLAGISLTFSATGLVHLFAGAGVSIVVMAIGFELAKTTLTIHMLQKYRKPAWATALGVPLILLTAIASIGIYGYLGKAYNEGRADVVVGAANVAVVEQEITALEKERERLFGQIEAIPAEHSTNRRRLSESLQPRIDAISQQIDVKAKERATAQRGQAKTEQSSGELRYAAELFGVTEEGLAKLVITVLAFLLDPLAILLILASGVKMRKEPVTPTEVRTVTRSPALPPEQPYHPIKGRYTVDTSEFEVVPPDDDLVQEFVEEMERRNVEWPEDKGWLEDLAQEAEAIQRVRKLPLGYEPFGTPDPVQAQRLLDELHHAVEPPLPSASPGLNEVLVRVRNGAVPVVIANAEKDA